VSALSAVRAPGVLRTLTLSLVARIPDGAIGLLLVLQARHLGFSYAIGGLASAATAVGMAVGTPLLGRVADRHGQPLVLHLSAAVAALCLAATSIVPASAPGLLIGLAVGCGLALPPISACVRAIWSRALAPEQLDTTLTLDASLQEIAFMIGPLVLASAASIAGAPAALVATAVLLWASTSAFALTPEARATRVLRPVRDRVSGAGALRSGGVRTLLAVSVTLGAAFGATEIGIVAFSDAAGASGSVGLLYAAWSVGSLVAGLLAAQRGHSGDPVRRAGALLLTLALGTALLAAAPDVGWLAAGLLLAGAAVAPLFAVVYALMGRVAPAGTVTEAYAWETTGIMGGIAIGSAAAGVIGAPAGMFAVAAATLLAGAIVVLRRARTLRPDPR
jgi:MFS family permease